MSRKIRQKTVFRCVVCNYTCSSVQNWHYDQSGLICSGKNVEEISFVIESQSDY